MTLNPKSVSLAILASLPAMLLGVNNSKQLTMALGAFIVKLLQSAAKDYYQTCNNQTQAGKSVLLEKRASLQIALENAFEQSAATFIACPKTEDTVQKIYSHIPAADRTNNTPTSTSLQPISAFYYVARGETCGLTQHGRKRLAYAYVHLATHETKETAGTLKTASLLSETNKHANPAEQPEDIRLKIQEYLHPAPKLYKEFDSIASHHITLELFPPHSKRTSKPKPSTLSMAETATFTVTFVTALVIGFLIRSSINLLSPDNTNSDSMTP